MANKQTSGLNRRQSVRITDRVLLSYAPVSEEKYNAIAEDYSNGISLANQDGLADIQVFIGAQSALNRLRERDEDLADFLKHMDTKISTLLQRVQGEPVVSYTDTSRPEQAFHFLVGLAIESVLFQDFIGLRLVPRLPFPLEGRHSGPL